MVMEWVASIDKLAPWNAFQGAGTLLTAAFAFLVYIEARRIRRAEWLSSTLGKWQEFNRLLIETGKADRWEQVRHGKVAPEQLTAEDKRLFLLFFNIQQVEFEASKSRLLPTTMGAAMASQIAQMRPLSSYIIPLLEDVGYEPRFREFLKRQLSRAPSAA
jgi:hypothetical protein